MKMNLNVKCLLMILPEEIAYKNKILSFECKLISYDSDKPQNISFLVDGYNRK